jgi:hypothetical protein
LIASIFGTVVRDQEWNKFLVGAFLGSVKKENNNGLESRGR